MPFTEGQWKRMRGNVHVNKLSDLTQAPLPESIYLDGRASGVIPRSNARRKQR